MEEAVSMERVMRGTCPFTGLPPLNKKVVRIFVSSTFSGNIHMFTIEHDLQSIKY